MNIIILGAGVFGTHMAEILSNLSHDLTVIDRDAKRISVLEDRMDIRSMVGNVISEYTLRQCGIENADLLLSMTNEDETNIVAASLGKKLGAKKTIARIKDRRLLNAWDTSYDQWFNIDFVLAPERLTAQEIAKRIGTAGFYVPKSLAHSNVALQEWTISEGSPFLHLPLKDITEFQNIIIPCIFRENDIIIPSGLDELQPKDRFYMVGATDDIASIAKKLRTSTSDNRVVLIFGGGEISFTLAKILENTRLSVKLVEPDAARCKLLSKALDKTLILNGSCLEEDFLLQQNIQKVDIFVGATPDEEDNLIASLVAKELGAKSTIVLTERREFVGTMRRLGVDTAVSPRLITANDLLKILFPGRIKTLIMLQENEAEVVEATVSPEAKGAGIPISEMHLPKGLIIAAIIRQGKVIVPRGDLILEAHDTVVIFTRSEHLDLIKKTF